LFVLLVVGVCFLGFVFGFGCFSGFVWFGFLLVCRCFLVDFLGFFVGDSFIFLFRVVFGGVVWWFVLSSVARDLLLAAADSIKKSMDYAVSQLNARKVRGEVKLRWSRSLTKQAEALVKIAESLENLQAGSKAEIDLASFLSEVERKVPRECITRRFSSTVRKVRLSGSRYEHRKV